MEEVLKGFVGKKIDLSCGSNVVCRGEVAAVEGGVLRMINEEGDDVYVAAEKVVTFVECKDFGSRPGFIV